MASEYLSEDTKNQETEEESICSKSIIDDENNDKIELSDGKREFDFEPDSKLQTSQSIIEKQACDAKCHKNDQKEGEKRNSNSTFDPLATADENEQKEKESNDEDFEVNMPPIKGARESHTQHSKIGIKLESHARVKGEDVEANQSITSNDENDDIRTLDSDTVAHRDMDVSHEFNKIEDLNDSDMNNEGSSTSENFLLEKNEIQNRNAQVDIETEMLEYTEHEGEENGRESCRRKTNSWRNFDFNIWTRSTTRNISEKECKTEKNSSELMIQEGTNEIEVEQTQPEENIGFGGNNSAPMVNETCQEEKSNDHLLANKCINSEVFDQEDPFGFEKEVQYDSECESAALEFFEEFETSVFEQKHDQNNIHENQLNCADLQDSMKDKYNEDISLNKFHHNQALFDILNRNVETLEPYVLSRMNKSITSSDLKLCFAALVAMLTPPQETLFVKEIERDFDDNGMINILPLLINTTQTTPKRRWPFNRFSAKSKPSIHSNQKIISKDVPVSIDVPITLSDSDVKHAKQVDQTNSQMYVCLDVAFTLWEKVLELRDIDFTHAEDTGSIRESALNYVKESLLNLELVDTDNRRTLLSSEIHALKSEKKEELGSNDVNEQGIVILVSRAINQQYGEYLLWDQQQTTIEYQKYWFEIVCANFTENVLSKDQGEYLPIMLPFLMIKAEKYRDASKLLCNKLFVEKRLNTLGMLKGTIAQVTDVDILNTYHSQHIADDSYYQIMGLIHDLIDKESHSVNFLGIMSPCSKALHLMGKSLGAQGHVTKELEFYTEALKLKRLGVKIDDNGIVTLSLSHTLHCMGFAHDNAGNWPNALKCYDEAISIRERLLGDHLMLAETYHYKGALMCENGQCDGAMHFLELALRIRKLKYGEDHETVADTQQWMGNVMRQWGEYGEALELFKKSLRIKTERLGNDHEDVANTLHNIAVILDETNKHRLALDCYKEALRIRELNFGQYNFEVADTLLFAANSCSMIEDGKESIKYFTHSINIREKLHGDDMAISSDGSFIGIIQPCSEIFVFRCNKLIECYDKLISLFKKFKKDDNDVIELLKQMGESYLKIQDWDKAIGSFQEALRYRKSNIVPETEDGDIKVVELTIKIGQVYIMMGEHNNAKACLNKAIISLKKSNQPHPEFIASAKYSLGVSFAKSDEHNTAFEYFTECFEIQTNEIKNRNCNISHTLHWLGKEHHALSEHSEALSRYTSVLFLYKKHKSIMKPQVVIETLHLMGNIHSMNNRFKMAFKCYNKEIIFSQSCSENAAKAYYCIGNIHARKENHHEAIDNFKLSVKSVKFGRWEEKEIVAKSLEKLGSMYEIVHDLPQAKIELQESFRIYRNILPTEIVTANVAFKLARVLDKMKEFASAMICYKEVLSVEKLHSHDFDDEKTATTLFFMGENYLAQGLFEESIKYFQQSLKIRQNILGDNDLTVAQTLQKLAKSYEFNRSNDKAILCYREAIRIKANVGSSNNDDFLAFIEIAKCYVSSKKYDLAVKYYLDFLHRVVDDHEMVPETHKQLGVLNDKLGNQKQSIKYFNSCLFHLTKGGKTISNCGMIFDVTQKLAESYSKENNYDKALELYSQLIDVSDPKKNSGCERLSDMFVEMGSLHLKGMSYNEALDNFEKGLKIKRRLKTRDDDNIAIANVLKNIAVIHNVKKDVPSAVVCLVEALRIFKMRKHFLDAASTLHLLARIKEKNHENDAAKECYMEAATIRKNELVQIQKKTENKREYHEEEAAQKLLFSTLFDYSQMFLKISEEEKALQLFQSAHEVIISLGETKELAQVYFEIGKIYMNRNEYGKTEKYLDHVLTFYRKSGNYEILFNCLYMLGFIHFSKKHYKIAIPFLVEAIEMNDKLNYDMVKLSSTMHYLGVSYLESEKYKDANDFLKKALKLRVIKEGKNSLEYAATSVSLGKVNFMTNEIQESLTYYREALQIFQDNYGNDHIDLAKTQEKIGNILFQLKDYESAISVLNQCLRNYRLHLSDDDKVLANIHLTIGKVLMKQRSFDCAIKQYRRCFAIYERLGFDNIAVANVLIEIGDCLYYTNQLSESSDYLYKALHIMEHELNKDEKCIAKVHEKIGNVFFVKKDFETAHASFKEAHLIYVRVFGKDSVQVGHLLYKIGQIYEMTKESTNVIECYMESLQLLTKYLGNNDIHVSLILNSLGSYYAKRKDLLNAVKYYTEALNIQKANLSKHHLDLAHTSYNLAKVLDEEGKHDDLIHLYTEALNIYQHNKEDLYSAKCLHRIASLEKTKPDQALFNNKEALRIYKNVYGENAIETAVILFDVGCIYKDKKNYEEASSYFIKSLKIKMADQGNNTTDVATTSQELASIFVLLEKYEEAAKLYKNALSIFNSILGDSDIKCAEIHFSLGKMYYSMGKYDNAVDKFKVCLQIYKDKFGDNSEEVAKTLIELGKIQDKRIDNEGAMRMLTSALKIRTELGGKEDKKVAETMLYIARVLEDWGDVEEAMEYFKEAMRIYRFHFGPNHTCLAEILNEIGDIHGERKDFDSALKSYDEALKIYREYLGEGACEVGHSLHKIGVIYDSMEKYEQSLRYFTEALDILKQALGNNDLSVALSLSSVSINLARNGQYAQSYDLCAKALRTRHAILGSNHLDVLDTLYNMGNILDEWGKLDQAMKFYSEALVKYRLNLGDDNEDVANCLQSIGLIHIRNEKHNTAIPLLFDALRIYRIKGGSESLDVARVLFNLGRIYGKGADYTKALSCFKECLKVRMKLLNSNHADISDARKYVDTIEKKMSR